MSASELRDLAVEIAIEAAAYISAQAANARSFIGTKSSPTDMVTEVDGASEAMIIARILAARPGDSILGEEGGSTVGTSGVRWIIDPLDGTTNFLYGIPAYAVSIAVELDGEVVAGVVVDVPHGETYAAAKGEGAFVDGVPLAVSAETDLARVLFATGFSYNPATRAHQANVLASLLPLLRDERRSGSAALDLCSVARGRVDAMYELLAPWDFSAGALIVAEAGGRVVTLLQPSGASMVVAANGHVFEEFQALIARHEPAARQSASPG